MWLKYPGSGYKSLNQVKTPFYLSDNGWYLGLVQNKRKRSKSQNHIVATQDGPVLIQYIIGGDSQGHYFGNNNYNYFNEDNFGLLYILNEDLKYLQMYYLIWYIINID